MEDWVVLPAAFMVPAPAPRALAAAVFGSTWGGAQINLTVYLKIVSTLKILSKSVSFT
jgi:hypothetical protein